MRFILNTRAVMFSQWLRSYWQWQTVPGGRTQLTLDRLRGTDNRLTAGGCFSVVAPTGDITMSPLDELVVFDLCPLDEKRVEVVITFHGFEKHIRPVRDDLLRAIKERWPGVAIQEEIADETEEATLRRLWADESLTKEEIADQMGYSPDWVDHQKAKLALPDRTRGRKKGKSSPHLK